MCVCLHHRGRLESGCQICNNFSELFFVSKLTGVSNFRFKYGMALGVFCRLCLTKPDIFFVGIGIAAPALPRNRKYDRLDSNRKRELARNSVFMTRTAPQSPSRMSEMGYFPLPDIVSVDPDVFKTIFPEWPEYCRRCPEHAGSMTRKESGYLVEIAQEVRRAP